MIDAQKRIGTIGFPTAKQRVLNEVDVVEVSSARAIPPKPATAKKWRKEAPGSVAFNVQVPRFLCESPPHETPLPGKLGSYGSFQLTEENLDLWERTIRFAEALQALCLVLLTPLEFTPTPAHIDAFSRFLSTVPRGKLDIVWELRGPWDRRQALAVASSNKLTLAVDPLRDPLPPGEAGYFRLGPFASFGTRLGVYELERLAEAMSKPQKATCVFETAHALDDARNLKKMINGG